MTQKLLRGEITPLEAATELGISEKQVWEHLYFHIDMKGKPATGLLSAEDIVEMVNEIIIKLKSIIDVNFTEGNVNAQLIRELRGLLSSALELADKYNSARINECQRQLKILEQAIFEVLDDDQRLRLMQLLEARDIERNTT